MPGSEPSAGGHQPTRSFRRDRSCCRAAIRSSCVRPGSLNIRRLGSTAAHGLAAQRSLYRLEASADYDPGPGLEKVQAPPLAVNSATTARHRAIARRRTRRRGRRVSDQNRSRAPAQAAALWMAKGTVPRSAASRSATAISASSEARRGIAVHVVQRQFGLEHDELLSLEVSGRNSPPRGTTHIACQQRITASELPVARPDPRGDATAERRAVAPLATTVRRPWCCVAVSYAALRHTVTLEIG